MRFGFVVDAQDKRIVQAAMTLQDGAAAGATAQDRHAGAPASFEIRLARCGIGIAQNDEIFGGLPEAEGLATARLAGVQQCFVGRQVGGRAGESRIPEIHFPQYLICQGWAQTISCSVLWVWLFHFKSLV